jgi:hypothetical protein
MALLFATMLPYCYTLELSFLSASFDRSLLLTAGHSPSKTCLHLQSPVISTRQQFAQHGASSMCKCGILYSLLVFAFQQTSLYSASTSIPIPIQELFLCVCHFWNLSKLYFLLLSFSGGKRAYSPPNSISAST